MKRILFYLLLLTALTAGCKGSSTYTDLDVDEFAQMLSDRQDGVLLLDVRTPEEFAEGHIPGALNVNWFDEDFMEQLEPVLRKDIPVLVYCRGGNRSARAAALIQSFGYTAYNLLGGYQSWTASGR